MSNEVFKNSSYDLTRTILNRTQNVSGTLTNIYDIDVLPKKLGFLNNKHFLGRLKALASEYRK